jgi:hypothetical protein|tara:strand:- start:2 stop:520 length:519 start_codon:yes stop_codon:yes gene_type:complete
LYQARCAAIDKAKIASIKASVDATSPPRFKHVTVNAKKLQMEENRLVEIEKRNMHLLDNLSRISARQSGLRGSNTGGPSSCDAADGVSKVTRKPKALTRGQAPPVTATRGAPKSLNSRKRRDELHRIETENAIILRRLQTQNSKESEFSVAKMKKQWRTTLEHRKRASQWIG